MALRRIAGAPQQCQQTAAAALRPAVPLRPVAVSRCFQQCSSRAASRGELHADHRLATRAVALSRCYAGGSSSSARDFRRAGAFVALATLPYFRKNFLPPLQCNIAAKFLRPLTLHAVLTKQCNDRTPAQRVQHCSNQQICRGLLHMVISFIAWLVFQPWASCQERGIQPVTTRARHSWWMAAACTSDHAACACQC